LFNFHKAWFKYFSNVVKVQET